MKWSLKPYTRIGVGAMLLMVSWAEARVLTIGTGGTYSQISDAIQWARDGDTISVASGTVDSPAVYYEQIDFQGKSLLIAAREVGTEDGHALDHPDPRATGCNA